MLNCSGAALWWCKFDGVWVNRFWDFAADSNTQTRVQLQEILPQPEGEDNIHVNLIQYHHGLAIYVPQFSMIFQYFQAFSCIAFLNGNPNG